MNQQLTPELARVRETVLRFVDEEIEPRAAEIDETNDIPDAILSQAASLGLFGLSIPEEYGGLGRSEQLSCTALAALGRGPAGVTIYVAPTAPAAAILAAGTDEQRQKYLPSLARGDSFASFCLSEAGSGSDASNIRTAAERKSDHWILDGSKMWISRATRADTFLVSAVTDPTKRRDGGITVFLIDRRKGVKIGRADQLLGLRGSGGAEVHFDGVRVEDHEVLGSVGGGFEVLSTTLSRARLWASARAVGITDRALELSLNYSRSREQFGKPIGDFQAVKLKLADMASDLYVSRLLVKTAAEHFDAGLEPRQETSLTKLFCTEAACRTADTAVQLHGAMGVSQDYSVERLFRDARAGRILDGTSDIQRLIVSKQLRVNGVGNALAPGSTQSPHAA